MKSVDLPGHHLLFQSMFSEFDGLLLLIIVIYAALTSKKARPFIQGCTKFIVRSQRQQFSPEIVEHPKSSTVKATHFGLRSNIGPVYCRCVNKMRCFA